MLTRILTLVVICLFLAGCDSGGYHGPVSNHFNGKTFFNTTPTEQRNFSDALKWWWTRKRVQWPKQIANRKFPPLMPIEDPNEVIITFINHATLLIQSKDYSILTDPIWSNTAGPFSWLGAKRVRPPGRTIDELPPINMVIISHGHYDHMDIPSLLTLEKKFHPIFLVPLGNKLFLEKKGLTHVVEMDWWQTYPIPHGDVTFLPTQHWTARWLNDRNKTLWGSYGIHLVGHAIYFAGDTGYSTHFKAIQAKWGSPQVAILPIGAYRPRWFMKPHHLMPAEAIQAQHDLQAPQAIGMHFGTFQLGDETYSAPIRDLETAERQSRSDRHSFIILGQGQSWQLDTPPPTAAEQDFINDDRQKDLAN